jgi:hypothetical protein
MEVKSLGAPAVLVERHQSLPTIAPPWPFLTLDANWVRNVQSQPQVKVRVGGAELNAFARVVRNAELAATVKTSTVGATVS